MKIATIVFTYNRPEHTKKTLDALKSNTTLPQKLYIFQDGRKENTDSEKWTSVNRIINEVDWCEHEIIVSDSNKGLADSIVSGINYAFQNSDAVIVLEDDIVTHPQFMEFMVASLEKYKGEKKVYNINADADTVSPRQNDSDAYFTGRCSSWGWATWKDRWQFFNRDYRIIARLKQNPVLNESFHFWASDVESYLIGNVTGKCNSWAGFWCLNVIEHEGYCLTPYKGFVTNIGFDGSGVHCGVSDIKSNCRLFDEIKPFVLPDKIEFPEDYKEVYDGYFSWTPLETKVAYYNKILKAWFPINGKGLVVKYLKEKEIRKISVYGMNYLLDFLLEELSDSVEVLSIIESNPRLTEYKGIPVVSVANIPAETELIVCIPSYDLERICRKLQYEDMGNTDIIGLDELLEKCKSKFYSLEQFLC